MSKNVPSALTPARAQFTWPAYSVHAALIIGILIWGSVAQAKDPPCADAHAKPSHCANLPDGWVCLSPQLAADIRAGEEAAVEKCRLEKIAADAVHASILRREVGKVAAEKKAVEVKLELALGLAEEAEEEAASRWTALEVVGWVAGGVAVGAAAGAVVFWLVDR